MLHSKYAEINFLPVCSNCHQVPRKTINYMPDNAPYTITPYCCPNCGALFETITIPTGFPFYTEEYIHMEKTEKKNDNVNHPTHYADHCSLECFDVMLCILGPVGTFEFYLGNAFKYLWRHKFKNGEEDVNKAGWYLTKADQLYSEYKDNELFLEEKNKLDQMMELYKMTKSGYME